MSYQVCKQLAKSRYQNRVPWEVVNDYAKNHPHITIRQIQQVFSSVHTNPDPCIEEWNTAISHTTNNGKPDRRYFDKDPDDKIKVSNGYVTVSTQWKNKPNGKGTFDNNFNDFCALAQTLGYIIIEP